MSLHCFWMSKWTSIRRVVIGVCELQAHVSRSPASLNTCQQPYKCYRDGCGQKHVDVNNSRNLLLSKSLAVCIRKGVLCKEGFHQNDCLRLERMLPTSQHCLPNQKSGLTLSWHITRRANKYHDVELICPYDILCVICVLSPYGQSNDFGWNSVLDIAYNWQLSRTPLAYLT